MSRIHNSAYRWRKQLNNTGEIKDNRKEGNQEKNLKRKGLILPMEYYAKVHSVI